MTCVLQESQAISLVSVAHVLGEAHPHRGFRRQPSHSDDVGPEKTDPGQKQRQFLSMFTCLHMHICLKPVCLLHTEKSILSDTSSSKSHSPPTPMAATGTHTHTHLCLLENGYTANQHKYHRRKDHTKYLDTAAVAWNILSDTFVSLSFSHINNWCNASEQFCWYLTLMIHDADDQIRSDDLHRVDRLAKEDPALHGHLKVNESNVFSYSCRSFMESSVWRQLDIVKWFNNISLERHMMLGVSTTHMVTSRSCKWPHTEVDWTLFQ